jgi:hypothetical protein
VKYVKKEAKEARCFSDVHIILAAIFPRGTGPFPSLAPSAARPFLWKNALAMKGTIKPVRTRIAVIRFSTQLLQEGIVYNIQKVVYIENAYYLHA